MPRWLRERKENWERLKGLAEQFAESAHAALGKVTVWIYGSVARGDFNFWSDVDVLVVAEKLPDRPLERLEMLIQFAPPMVEPIGYIKKSLSVCWQYATRT